MRYMLYGIRIAMLYTRYAAGWSDDCGLICELRDVGRRFLIIKETNSRCVMEKEVRWVCPTPFGDCVDNERLVYNVNSLAEEID